MKTLRSQDCTNQYLFKQKGIVKRVADYRANSRYVNIKLLFDIIYTYT